MIAFRVNGTPAPQGSKRHVGGGRMVESSRAVGPWREAVRAEAQREANRLGWFETACFETVPVSVVLVFILPRPKSHFTSKGALTKSAPAYPRRPDLDKLVRAVLDGLTAGGVVADDSQVTSLDAAKVYASNGQIPGVVIEVEGP